MVVSESLPGSIDLGPPVTVEGRETFDLDADTLADFDVRTESVTVVCASGNRHTADWTGVTMVDLLEAAGVPQSTTHVVVESLDEYRVAIPVREAIDGLLAFVKDGEAIGATHEYANRFVSPATEGARDIKGVSRIEHTTLRPEEDPEALENLFPDGERFTANRFAEDEADQTQ